MNNSNLSSPETSVYDLALEVDDLPKRDAAYLNFIELYQAACEKKLTNEQKVNEAKRQWAAMTEEQRMQFVPGKSNASLSVKSVSGEQLMEGVGTKSTAKSDVAFNNFMESYTIRLSEKAAQRWEAMTKAERAEYAAKDDLNGSASDMSYVQDPSVPQRANDMFRAGGLDSCRRKRRSCPKPKCSKPKPKCRKRKPICKPKCAKPRPKCRRPKKRCIKPKPPC